MEQQKAGSSLDNLRQYFQQQRITKDIQHVIASVYDWMICANFYTIRKFFLGIIHRIDSLELLHNVIQVLSTVLQKDFTYSRSQCNSSLLHEHKEFSSDKHILTTKIINKQVLEVWKWFSSLNKMNKTSFIFCVSMMLDDSSILHQAVNLAKTLYFQMKNEISKEESMSVDDKDTSLASTDYSFHTDEHPDLYMLAALSSHYRPSQQSIKEEVNEYEQDYTDENFEKVSSISGASSSTTSSLDPRVLVVAHSKQAQSGVSRFIDFVSMLPVHLAKKVIDLLDLHNQSNAALVNKLWHDIVRQVQTESRTRQEIIEEAVMMQGVSAKGAHPNYAKKKIVSVPVYSLANQKKFSVDHFQKSAGVDSIKLAIPDIKLAQFEMEERNVYCGSYNVLILDKQSDKNRVVHYDGGDIVATGSTDRTIRLFNTCSGREVFPSIRGHPGSITSVFVAGTEKKIIFSGSYDTTIRRWHLGSSSCHQIMHGHRKSITTLDYFDQTLVSGSKDGLVKLWNIKTGKCTCTFRHARCSNVTSVKILGNTVVSSCNRGMIKVWDLSARKLAKCLRGHTDAVVGVSMDEHYIVSASHDEYVLAWIKEGNIDHAVKSYRHPREVLCIELRYLRIISGCADGKIRVLHLHSGECLRVVRGNSKCDPILSLCATDNRLIVNTESNLLLLQFEQVELKYDLKYHQAIKASAEKLSATEKPFSRLNHSNSYVRACRNRASSITCSNLRNRPISAPVKKQVMPLKLSRPSSSFPALMQTKDRYQVGLRPRSNYSLPPSEYSVVQRETAFENGNFNKHNSRAMSVVSGISCIILQQDSKLDEHLSRRSSQSGFSNRKDIQSWLSHQQPPQSRERLHLRIGSIYHNSRNEPVNINTAINGGHPDVREIYHATMEIMKSDT